VVLLVAAVWIVVAGVDIQFGEVPGWLLAVGGASLVILAIQALIYRFTRLRFREYEPTIELSVTQRQQDAWLDGSFMVECKVKGQQVKVRVRSGSAKIHEPQKNPGSVSLRSLRVALARRIDGIDDPDDNTTYHPDQPWDVVARSRRHRVGGEIDEASSLSLGGRELSLRLPKDTELHQVWLVVELDVERGPRTWWRLWRRPEQQISTIHACGRMGPPIPKEKGARRPGQDSANEKGTAVAQA